MSSLSSIEWTDATWNPVAGCAVVSPGCTNCYAMRMAARLDAMGQEKYVGLTRKSGGRYVWRGKVRLDYDSLNVPHNLGETTQNIRQQHVRPLSRRSAVRLCPSGVRGYGGYSRHTYQVLTKRADRLLELSRRLHWPSNTWLGVSVENEDVLWRVDYLRKLGPGIKFLSCEPLIGPLPNLKLKGIDWVIAGGESGPRARPMVADWVRQIRDKCRTAGVPFHFKQWGGPVKSLTGRILDGRTWDGFPLEAPIGLQPP